MNSNGTLIALLQSLLGNFSLFINTEQEFFSEWFMADKPLVHLPPPPSVLLLPPPTPGPLLLKVSMHRGHFHNYVRPVRLNNGLNSSYCWI